MVDVDDAVVESKRAAHDFARAADELRRQGLRRRLGAAPHHPRYHASVPRSMAASVARLLARKDRSALSAPKYFLIPRDTAWPTAGDKPFLQTCGVQPANADVGKGIAMGLFSPAAFIPYNAAPAATAIDVTRQSTKILLKSVTFWSRYIGDTSGAPAFTTAKLKIMHGKYYCDDPMGTTIINGGAFLLADRYGLEPTVTRDPNPIWKFYDYPMVPSYEQRRWKYHAEHHEFGVLVANCPQPVASSTGPVVATSADQTAKAFTTLYHDLDWKGQKHGNWKARVECNAVIQYLEIDTGSTTHPVEPYLFLFQWSNSEDKNIGVFHDMVVIVEWQDYLSDAS